VNEPTVSLDQYTTGHYTPGASIVQQLLWHFVGAALLQSYVIPISSFKVWLLRRFGAQVGQGVRIKPGVKVKFPWRLIVGNHCWIGEGAWLDNLAMITLEDHVCLSQGVYLCTGNHNWKDPGFALILGAIYIETGSWIAAQAAIGPGVTVGQGAILCLGSVANHDLETMTIYAGSPAVLIKKRVMSERSPLANPDAI
jgi:putative colanic acid biosynthesis acetyltransferase WcaF